MYYNIINKNKVKKFCDIKPNHYISASNPRIGESIVYHILARTNLNFVKFGLLLAHQLITRGGIRPKQIVISIDEINADKFARPYCKKIGCSINRLSKFHIENKQHALSQIVRAHKQTKTFCQMDADMYLAGELDINSCVEKAYEDVSLMSNLLPSQSQWVSRTKVSYHHPYDGDNEHGITQRAQAIRHLTGVDFHSFWNWMSDKQWISGGVFIFRRSIVTKKFWQVFMAYAVISWSDESALMLARFADPEASCFFGEPIIPCEYTGDRYIKDQIKTFNGLVHYASQPTKDKNISWLNDKFDEELGML